MKVLLPRVDWKDRFVRRSLRFVVLLLWGCLFAEVRAGDFVNLGFNDPDLTHAYYESGRFCTVAPVAEALRGWSVWTSEELPYNGFITVTEDGPPFGLKSAGERYGPYVLGFNLFRDLSFVNLRPTVRISQTGTIPMGSPLLRFHQYSGGSPSDSPIVVFISGVEQPTLEPWWYHDNTVDLSAFAGQEVTLEFLIPSGMYCNFDIFGFYPVPEPSTWALLVIGGTALWRFHRRRQQ